ncbi:DUF4129 domain-containing protein [Halostreptopolyspora alba]|uniref:DUF4129 domain-containing protein n=1 Tax=Halostreptopolyspora alba TaxID=2487137 RepID=A0A3N0E118_9ACTN|nr:DUF4129 domain-containing protein [Nocardiopsaceae bacterium YIM 96095]
MTGPFTSAGPAPVPATVSREEGARHARDELSERIYQDAEPGPIEWVIIRVNEALSWMEAHLGGVLPGGWPLLGLLLGLLLALLAGLLLYTRPVRRAKRHRAVLPTGAPHTAADHRATADEHAAAGAYGEAVRERLRAVTRDLEERAIITPRPGRTATELATEASAALPDRREALHDAAALFNDVVYGDRAATADDERSLRELDDRLRQTRPAGDGGSTA